MPASLSRPGARPAFPATAAGAVAVRVRIVEIGILGPVQAHDGDGTRLLIPGGRPLTLLALLLTRRGTVVSPEYAAEALWPGRPPKDPANALQLAVSRLRK